MPLILLLLLGHFAFSRPAPDLWYQAVEFSSQDPEVLCIALPESVRLECFTEGGVPQSVLGVVLLDIDMTVGLT